MAAAFPTVAVSIVYIIWNACRRCGRRLPHLPPPASQASGDEHVEHRLDCLSVLARPLPRRRR
jgi:hypothetical protein